MTTSESERPPVGVALVGCGAVANLQRTAVYPHVQQYGRVVATVDPDLAKATALAERLRQLYAGGQGEGEPITPYTDLAAALADPRVQAVDVCTPHKLHSPLTLQAVAAGKHVLVEKPLAVTLEDGRQMIEAAEKAGVVLAVNEQVRFMEPLLKAREMIDRGELGKLATVRAHRIGYLAGPYNDSGWRRDASAAGGGMLLDQGPHYFHGLRLLAGGVAGEITHVSALGTTMRDDWLPGTEDTATVIVRFASGLIGEALFCWATRTAALGSWYYAYGANGSLEMISRDAGLTWHQAGERVTDRGAAPGETRREPKSEVLVEAGLGNGIQAQVSCITNFMRAARGECEPSMPGIEGWRDLAVVDAAYRSIRSERLETVQSW